MEIQCTINHQTLTIEQRKLANHSQKYLEISFDFKTDDWNGLTKFALFTSQGKTYRVPITNGKATAPNAVLTGDRFSIGAYGLGEDELRVTTNRCRFSLAESGYTIDIENDLPDVDPSVLEQIYLDIDKAKSEAEDYADTGLAEKSDIGHTHTESDITDLKEYSEVGHTHKEADITDLKEYVQVTDIVDDLTSTDTDKPLSAKQGKALKGMVDGKSEIGHTHTESDITDLQDYSLVGHEHVKSDITDFTHTHTKSDITDFEHNHDDRYYTETEVNNIIDELKHDLLNRCNLTSDRQILQTDETADITAYLIENGIPKANTTIYFYKEEDL